MFSMRMLSQVRGTKLINSFWIVTRFRVLKDVHNNQIILMYDTLSEIRASEYKLVFFVCYKEDITYLTLLGKD